MFLVCSGSETGGNIISPHLAFRKVSSLRYHPIVQPDGKFVWFTDVRPYTDRCLLNVAMLLNPSAYDCCKPISVDNKNDYFTFTCVFTLGNYD